MMSYKPGSLFVCCVHFDRGIESDLMTMTIMQFSYSGYRIEVMVMTISMQSMRLPCTPYRNE
jgi:hypothetical protein